MDMRIFPFLGRGVDGRGHKNYCYQRYLAEEAPFDSFRFDFRGNGDSGRSIHAPRTLKVSLGNFRIVSWQAINLCRMIWTI